MEDYINPTERVPGVDREQQIWTYRFAIPKPITRLPAPTELSLTTSKTSAKLKWQLVKGAKKYAIYRGITDVLLR